MKISDKRHLQICWLVTAVFMVSLLILTYLFFSFLSPRLLSHRANRIFQNKETVAWTLLQQIAKTKNIGTYVEADREDMIFLCYDRDTLVYWNSNKETVPFRLSKFEDLNQQLVELKTGSFYRKILKQGDSTFIALIPVYYSYSVENNDFNNHFVSFLQLPVGSVISCSEEDFSIITKEGDFLCSIVFPNKMVFEGWRFQLVFLLFLFGFASFIFSILQTVSYYAKRTSRKKIRFFAGLFAVSVFTAAILLLRLPKTIFYHPLFSPEYFSYNRLLSSSGQMLIISIYCIITSYFTYSFFKPKQRSSIWMFFCYSILSGGLYCLFAFLHNILITNASVFTDLAFVFNIDIYSLLHLATLLAFSMSCFFLNTLCVKMLKINTLRHNLFIAAIILAVSMLIAWLFHSWLHGVCCLLWSIVPTFILRYNKITSTRFLFYNVVVVALLSALLSSHYTNKAERKHRLLLAENFSERGRKEDREYYFEKLTEKILDDKNVQGYLKNFSDTMPVKYDKSIADYITNTYFNKTWFEYQVNINVCSTSDILATSFEDGEQSCLDFFDKKIQTSGKPTMSPNLFVFANEYFLTYYIGIIKPKALDSTKKLPVFFIELVPLQHYNEPDYPELFGNLNMMKFINAARYSYAVYDSNGLLYSFGDENFPFSLTCCSNCQVTLEKAFFKFKDKSWLQYPLQDDKILIISLRNKSIPQLLAPYIYMLIACLILLYLVCLSAGTPFNLISVSQLRSKLQHAILIVLSIAFISIGITVFLFINMLKNQKNEENLQQKTKSIMNVLSSNYPDLQLMLHDKEQYSERTLQELSAVFFSEINLFDITGELAVSSSPIIFKYGFLSPLMDYRTLTRITTKQEYAVVQQEWLGKKRFLSSYSAIYDDNDRPVAILNVTHIAHSGQHEHNTEVFISTFITVYSIVFLLFLVVLLYLSNQITRPIRLLTQYFGNIRIGTRNTKLQWNGNDEFSKMVEEYNRMIDDLEISTKKLAASERESGWRDMAQQVAHEIKNPLTPMRLTEQQLQRIWKKADFSSEQMERFCNTIIRQIDALSDIASIFSYYAKMPAPLFQYIDLKEILSGAIAIYDNSGVQFRVSGFENCHLNADPSLILRVFNNLIKNAIEAIEIKEQGIVSINAIKTNTTVVVTMLDNGQGIEPDVLKRIFVPTFTTRSSGMGLGLPMVKTIIEEHNGEINITSEKGKGTTITIVFRL